MMASRNSKRSIALSTLMIAAVAPMLAQTAAAADGEPAIRCALHACIVAHTTQDSDGDNVSNDDERAAGTDPFDATSTPGMSKIQQLLSRGLLPSFQEGRSVLVVLPTRAPNGASIFGGPKALPGRKNVLSGLGINPDQLGGLSLTNGLAIAIGKGPGTGGKPPVRFGGIDMSLISAGSGPSQATIDVALNHSPNKGEWPVDIAVGKTGQTSLGSSHGNMLVTRDNGSADMVVWTKVGNTTSVQVTSTDAKGKPSGVTNAWSSSNTSTDKAGNTTASSSNAWSSTSKDVSKEETRTENVTTSADGTKVFKDTSQSNKTTDAGGKTTTTNTSSSNYYEKGKWVEGTKTTVTTTCSSGNCTSTVTTQGGSTECTDDTCTGNASAYVAQDDNSYDPSADLRRMGFTTAKTVNIALAVAGGNITYGPSPTADATEPEAASTPDGPLVIHVEEDPTWSSFGASIGTGDPRKTNTPEPRFDPNLPNPLRDGFELPPAPNCNKPGTC
jgi:hypothetical protein